MAEAAASLKPEAQPAAVAGDDRWLETAYRAFCQTGQYKVAFYEAEKVSGIDTALWIAFVRGFSAAHAEADTAARAEERERAIDAVNRISLKYAILHSETKRPDVAIEAFCKREMAEEVVSAIRDLPLKLAIIAKATAS